MNLHSQPDDRGFTRVSVLLGVALAIVVVLVFGSRARIERPAADPIAWEQPLQEALQDALSSFVRRKLVQEVVPCADPEAFFQSHLYLRTYSGSLGQMRATPPAGLSAAAWDELFQGSMASQGFAGAALSRCSLTVLGTGGRFHFCLNVERDESAPQGSFLHAPFVFAEVSIQLQDLQSGKSLSCAQYLEPQRFSAGATIEYQLFSIQNQSDKLEVVKDRKRFSLRR